MIYYTAWKAAWRSCCYAQKSAISPPAVTKWSHTFIFWMISLLTSSLFNWSWIVRPWTPQTHLSVQERCSRYTEWKMKSNKWKCQNKTKFCFLHSSATNPVSSDLIWKMLIQNRMIALLDFSWCMQAMILPVHMCYQNKKLDSTTIVNVVCRPGLILITLNQP